MTKYTGKMVQSLCLLQSLRRALAECSHWVAMLGSSRRLLLMAVRFRFIFCCLQKTKHCAFVPPFVLFASFFSQTQNLSYLKYSKAIAVHQFTNILIKMMLTHKKLPETPMTAGLQHAEAFPASVLQPLLKMLTVAWRNIPIFYIWLFFYYANSTSHLKPCSCILSIIN